VQLPLLHCYDRHSTTPVLFRPGSRGSLIGSIRGLTHRPTSTANRFPINKPTKTWQSVVAKKRVGW